MSDEKLDSILAALPGVEANQVTIAWDSSAGVFAAKVLLRKDQLAQVFRENGRYVRDAAMNTGVRIDVELAK